MEMSDVVTISLARTFQNAIMKQIANIKKSVPLDRCPDNYVGHVCIANNIVTDVDLWFCSNLRISHHHEVGESKGLKDVKGFDIKRHYKTIVIILESPHKDEYNKIKNVIAPALGTTGCNLDDGFVDKLNNFMTANNSIIKDGIYHVVLMNAVQFQCSMGLKPIVGKIRDENFLSLWASDDIVESFKKRLKKYQPNIIINCCTNGNITQGMVNEIFNKPQKDKYKQLLLDNKGRKYFLYGFVQNVIEELFRGDKVKKLRCTHPSSWVRNKKDAKITN